MRSASRLSLARNWPALKEVRSCFAEINQLTPRLCHLKKRPDYSGYGFSLRFDEQDGRQHFSRVKIGSPAEEVGLMEGDILVEINDVKVEGEAHGIVLQRIIDSGNEVHLLVVDTETDKFYKDQGVTVTGEMPGVKRIVSGTNTFRTNLNGPNGQQQTNPYYADYDHGPWNEPRQLNPFQPSNGRSVGGPGGSYPMIQQPRTSTVIQPAVDQTDIPCDLTTPAVLICCCFCWCIGIAGIYSASKATEYYRKGDFKQGKRHRILAIIAMVGTVIAGIVLGGLSYYVNYSLYL